MYDVRVIQENGTGAGKKTFFKRCGVGFDNRDGSINFKLDLFPGVTFNLKTRPAGEGEHGHES